MANDALLRSCFVSLAAVVALVGIYTLSLKKMMATYLLGMSGISGVLLPDWDFFSRDFSRWCTPVSVEERACAAQRSFFSRFRLYPLVLLYTMVYGFALYKWWAFISS